jgi:cystathionine beta-synthase
MVDHFEKVTDRDAAIYTREIVRQEGIWVGNSAGSAIAGLLQLKDNFRKGELVVVIFHDHGTRYLGKMFNDEWMREKGFFDKSGLLARDIVSAKQRVPLVTLECRDTVARAIQVMTQHDFSQLPVTRDGRIVGGLNETHLYAELVRQPEIKTQPIESVMQPAFPFVDSLTPLDSLATMITPQNPAVLVRDFKTDKTFIITRSDLIRVL